MKVNDYVRSSWGTISRIKKYEHDEDGTGFSINIENECFGTHYKNKSQFDNDYKTSPKIGKLLKVGDFIDNHCIVDIINTTIFTNDGWFIDFDDVKDLVVSIVTKEQFSQMEYRIGE